MNPADCPFCNIEEEVLVQNRHCFAIADRYPVSEGHTLIIAKRHVRDYFELDKEEREACFDLLDQVKHDLDNRLDPDGWNIGINCGSVAGQTVFHFHCHLIPRYEGDMEDPRGGVRHTIKGKGYY